MCITHKFWTLKIVFCMFLISFTNWVLRTIFVFCPFWVANTSFLTSKIENCFWKQKIRGKTVTKHTLRVSLDCTEKEKNACLRFFFWSRALFMGLTSTDFSKFFFKTGSHDTIHTFKNYITTVFSVFSNKRYPNRPLVCVWHWLKRKMRRRKI